ncbi:ClpP/crotonase-like domain-containing protein [Calycina marina]|uniref:ClpP/crotonase-like domain-containing protein n=1 Tax=Calycina marina TaxID=1763456 RepID=A0A9P7Z3E2_9HELO|nr:ClpP/crotonase-like domain-containing protein [Calycina marina]
MSPSTFTTPPPKLQDAKISFPAPTILLINLNRPDALNCISIPGHYELQALYSWFDTEPSLRVAILTGEGRAFCAGADLKEWHEANKPHAPASTQERVIPASGFGALSRRGGKKPVICAVNGVCFGGGTEMIINADIVIAERHAVFGLPEVKIGVVALAGALTRLVRTVGRQRAMEMALTGRTVPAEEAREWGLVNKVVEKGESVNEAIKIAEAIALTSPDSMIVTREGIKMGWEGIGAEEGTRLLMENWYGRMDKGENMREGVASFVEKRKPNYVPSKL